MPTFHANALRCGCSTRAVIDWENHRHLEILRNGVRIRNVLPFFFPSPSPPPVLLSSPPPFIPFHCSCL